MVHIDFVKYMKTAVILSILVIVASISAIILRGGLRWGVDFIGGTEIRIRLAGGGKSGGAEDYGPAGFAANDDKRPAGSGKISEGGIQGLRDCLLEEGLCIDLTPALIAGFGGCRATLRRRFLLIGLLFVQQHLSICHLGTFI